MLQSQPSKIHFIQLFSPAGNTFKIFVLLYKLDPSIYGWKLWTTSKFHFNYFTNMYSRDQDNGMFGSHQEISTMYAYGMMLARFICFAIRTNEDQDFKWTEDYPFLDTQSDLLKELRRCCGGRPVNQKECIEFV